MKRLSSKMLRNYIDNPRKYDKIIRKLAGISAHKQFTVCMWPKSSRGIIELKD